MAAIGVANAALAYEAHDPGRIETAVAQPATPHVESPPDPVRGRGGRAAPRLFVQFASEFRRDALVGVEDQDPFVPRLRTLQRPVPLSAEAVEGTLKKTNAVRA